jgi:hypothetical protein
MRTRHSAMLYVHTLLTLKYYIPFIFILRNTIQLYQLNSQLPVPVAARLKASVCGRSPAEILGSNPTEGMAVCLLCVVR